MMEKDRRVFIQSFKKLSLYLGASFGAFTCLVGEQEIISS